VPPGSPPLPSRRNARRPDSRGSWHQPRSFTSKVSKPGFPAMRTVASTELLVITPAMTSRFHCAACRCASKSVPITRIGTGSIGNEDVSVRIVMPSWRSNFLRTPFQDQLSGIPLRRPLPHRSTIRAAINTAWRSRR
jgi:hypothetical protein